MTGATHLLRRLGLVLAAGAALGALAAGVALLPYAREPWRTGGLAVAAFHRGEAVARLELGLLCALGSPSAHRATGEAALSGLGGLGPDDAHRHLAAAARRGDLAAQLLLGKALLLGQGGLERDPVEAASWLRRAAEAGDPAAAYWLAVLHRSDLGGRDDRAAIPWLERAAAAGLPAARYLLGTAYRDGRGVEPDQARALALLEAAAEDEHPEALQALALASEAGGLGLARDRRRARQLREELEHAVRHPSLLP